MSVLGGQFKLEIRGQFKLDTGDHFELDEGGQVGLDFPVKQQTLKRDPFSGYRLEIPPIQHRHLSGEQLEKLMSVHLPTYRLCHTRDLFIFSVFTGLGRAEMAELSSEHIITAEDSSKWIRINRVKTKAECNIKLMDIPIRIMEKYKGEGKGDKIFYVPATSSLSRSLQIIADKCQLGCHLTYYLRSHNKSYNKLKMNELQILFCR